VQAMNGRIRIVISVERVLSLGTARLRRILRLDGEEGRMEGGV
jgi:hypothetical protein